MLEDGAGPTAESCFTAQVESLKRRLLDSESERESLRGQVETLTRENESLRGV